MSPLTILTTLLLLLPLTTAQFIASLPSCIQTCISQSSDTNCGLLSLTCLCTAAASGSFLTNTLICVQSTCDNSLDDNLLLTPFQLACEVAGVPISTSAIASAESAESSLGSATVTTTVGGSSTASVEILTEAQTMTEGDTTVVEVWPLTIEASTTLVGPTSTIVQTASVTGSGSGSVVIHTTTNSVRSTEPSVLTVSTGGDVGVSTVTMTTSIAAQTNTASSTSSGKESKTLKAPDPNETEGAPFTDTNNDAGMVRCGRWLAAWSVFWVGWVMW